jgi:hypothetical protein
MFSAGHGDRLSSFFGFSYKWVCGLRNLTEDVFLSPPRIYQNPLRLIRTDELYSTGGIGVVTYIACMKRTRKKLTGDQRMNLKLDYAQSQHGS